jgi:hypothetical protein
MAELPAKPVFFADNMPRSTSTSAKQKPEPKTATPPDASDLKERLKTLEDLREQGLISDDEYRAKREKLLDSL